MRRDIWNERRAGWRGGGRRLGVEEDAGAAQVPPDDAALCHHADTWDDQIESVGQIARISNREHGAIRR